eukprot:TRINITY_DN3646_c0_g1_i1.p1 TRINITY_DN3646_c0_g1~~TRINITY_DN3646_c0_g1_i1.p1  ORF type:complete len:156 (-),score=30.54 TRINITY_DN3646_c0_g1_i1:71-538(-)
MDVLPVKYNLTQPLTFEVFGISLGGHASLLSIANDPRITTCVSLIGCGDYLALMKTRRGVQMESHFPQSFLSLLSRVDPVSQPAAFKDKNIYLAQGEDDKLVPASCNELFYESIKGVAQNVVLKSYPGVAHQVTPQMLEDIFQWLSALHPTPSHY